MEVIVIGCDAFNKLLAENHKAISKEVKKALEKALAAKSENDWISGQDAKQLLGVKSKTKMQQLRDNQKIVFSQHGRTIMYSKKSILDFINKNIVEKSRRRKDESNE